jgi:toxin ParE1/3/4
MTRVTYSARARRELIKIIETIAVDNPRIANAFASQLEHHCSLLANHPEMGRARPEIGAEVRSLVRGNYLVFYRWKRERDQVVILCVRHGSRRLPWLD